MRSITVGPGNGTLFHIAAAELGDPLQWSRLALANGLWDPWLPPGLTTLLIPATVELATGGVLGGSPGS